MMKNSGDFNSGIDECTDKIQEAETMQDILKVKNFLVLEMQKARQHSLNLYEELEKHRTASETLT